MEADVNMDVITAAAEKLSTGDNTEAIVHVPFVKNFSGYSIATYTEIMRLQVRQNLGLKVNIFPVTCLNQCCAEAFKVVLLDYDPDVTSEST